MFNIKQLCLSAFALTLIIPAAHVRADTTADARKAIQAQYDRANAAFAKKDLKGAFAIDTADYTSTNEKGVKQTLAESKQQASTVLGMATSMNAASTIQTISISGGTATVRVKEHAKVVMSNPQTKQPSTLVIDSVSDDVWVKRGGSWLQKGSTSKSTKLLVDGKPVGP